MFLIHSHTLPPAGRGRSGLRARQAGLTLIELMISITVGLFLVAGLATLIANQSGTRAEIDKSGRMIESGRYALQTLVQDLQLAGYWGELSIIPTAPAALPDPCATAVADIQPALPLHLQGKSDVIVATLATEPITCVTNQLANTDVLVIRRTDTQEIPLASAVAGQVYVQTGLTPSGMGLEYRMGTGSDTSVFTLKKKDGTAASLRKVLIHIYYVSQCSEPVANSCAGADGGTPIPTLKRMELGVAAGNPAMTAVSIAEGIENLQIDYGVDTDNDGVPDGDYTNGAALGVSDWPNVMSVKVNLLAKSPETTAGYTDTKLYDLGSFKTTAAMNDHYKRHVFSQTVRIINPSGRRPL